MDAITRVNAILDGKLDPLIPALSHPLPQFGAALLASFDHALAFHPKGRPRRSQNGVRTSSVVTKSLRPCACQCQFRMSRGLALVIPVSRVARARRQTRLQRAKRQGADNRC